jgi:hypothetical protein
MTDAAYAFPAELTHEQARIRAIASKSALYKTGNFTNRGKANERHHKTNGNASQLAATAILDYMAILISDDEHECVCALLDAKTPIMDAIKIAVFGDEKLAPGGNKMTKLIGRVWK